MGSSTVGKLKAEATPEGSWNINLQKSHKSGKKRDERGNSPL